MKTICFIVPSFPTISETFVTNQVLQAKKDGYHVILLTKNLLSLHDSSQEALLIKYNILQYTYLIDFKIPIDKTKRRIQSFLLVVKFFKYWIRVKNLPFRKRFSTLPFQFQFYNKFKSVSVFHIQFATSGLELAKMKSIGLLSGRIITTFHGYDAHFKNQNELLQLQKRYRLLLKESRYLTVNTPYLAKKVELLGSIADKIRVIPMGIDLDFFQTSIEKTLSDHSVVNLISVGRLIELKGFEYAIKSVNRIIEEGYNVRYTIIGAGEEKDKLVKLISKLELTSHVYLVGPKNQKEIKTLLEESHIFLMSSITDNSNRAEAQGVVTAEAQIMGLPIVAFRSGGVPFTILENETGFLVDEKNVEAYASAIKRLLENHSLYKMMSMAAKDFIKSNFSNELLSKRLFELYYEN